MAKVGSAFASADGSGAVWFKIDEGGEWAKFNRDYGAAVTENPFYIGLLSGTVNKGTWGLGTVLKTLQWTTTIPATLAPGNYLIRVRLLNQFLINVNCILNYESSTNFWLFTKPTLLNSTLSAHRLRLQVLVLVLHPALTWHLSLVPTRCPILGKHFISLDVWSWTFWLTVSSGSVTIDIYSSTATTYKIPGPAKWTG